VPLTNAGPPQRLLLWGACHLPCTRCIIKFKALCRLGEPKQAESGRGAGGRWALVLEYAKVSTVQNFLSAFFRADRVCVSCQLCTGPLVVLAWMSAAAKAGDHTWVSAGVGEQLQQAGCFLK